MPCKPIDCSLRDTSMQISGRLTEAFLKLRIYLASGVYIKS